LSIGGGKYRQVKVMGGRRKEYSALSWIRGGSALRVDKRKTGHCLATARENHKNVALECTGTEGRLRGLNTGSVLYVRRKRRRAKVTVDGWGGG